MFRVDSDIVDCDDFVTFGDGGPAVTTCANQTQPVSTGQASGRRRFRVALIITERTVEAPVRVHDFVHATDVCDEDIARQGVWGLVREIRGLLTQLADDNVFNGRLLLFDDQTFLAEGVKAIQNPRIC